MRSAEIGSTTSAGIDTESAAVVSSASEPAQVERRSASATTRQKTLIIIPAHNEEKNIGKVLDELRSLDLGHDVLVINDASTDHTGRVLEEHGQRSLRLRTCLGYGGAVQAGFKYALRHGFDFVVQMDGDFQHDPRSIPTLLAAVREGDADLALGSRFLGEVRYRVPILRRAGMALFRTLVSCLMRRRITDPTSGFQAMRRNVVEFFAGETYPMDYPDSDVLLCLHLAGFRIEEVPVVMRPRLEGESIHGGLRTVYYLAKMFLAIPMVLLRHLARPRGRSEDPSP